MKYFREVFFSKRFWNACPWRWLTCLNKIWAASAGLALNRALQEMSGDLWKSFPIYVILCFWSKEQSSDVCNEIRKICVLFLSLLTQSIMKISLFLVLLLSLLIELFLFSWCWYSLVFLSFLCFLNSLFLVYGKNCLSSVRKIFHSKRMRMGVLVHIRNCDTCRAWKWAFREEWEQDRCADGIFFWHSRRKDPVSSFQWIFWVLVGLIVLTSTTLQ